jgi:hypothetical protein
LTLAPLPISVLIGLHGAGLVVPWADGPNGASPKEDVGSRLEHNIICCCSWQVVVVVVVVWLRQGAWSQNTLLFAADGTNNGSPNTGLVGMLWWRL